MADFVSKSTVKSAERVIATPMASKKVMNTIVGNIIADNPWGCTSYISAGETIPGISKSSESYTGTVVYENNEGKQVGRLSVRAGTSGAFDTIMTNILANTAIATSMGGTCSHDSSEDGFNVTLKCHTESGEFYSLMGVLFGSGSGADIY